MYCLLSPIHHELVPKYETANFTNTLPTHFPFLFLFTFVFLASLQLDSSLYFLFFLLSAFLPLSHFVFICISLSFCLHVYFNIFGFTLPNMIPETTLRAGRSGLRIPVAQRDCPPPPKGTDRLCGPASVLFHEYRVSFPEGEILTTLLHLASRLRKSCVIRLSPY